MDALSVLGMMGRGASSPLRHPPSATLPSYSAFIGITYVRGHASARGFYYYAGHRSVALLLACTRLVPWAEGQTWN